jgi:anion-transporting  ArsA/GET3 family ATPase
VVAAPEPDALREASYFVERLSQDEIPLAGLVVNRMHHAAPGLTARRAEAAADALDEKADPDLALAEAALRVQVETALTAEEDSRMARRFAAAHPDVATVTVPALPVDVHDLDGLRRIGVHLAR